MTQIEPALTPECNTYSSAVERWQEQRRLVGLVIAAYRAVKDLPSITALNPDPDSRSNSNRWNPDSAHFAVDVENTVRRVIESRLETERPALRAAWESLLSDDATLGTNEQKLVRLLAGPFFTKELHPGLYFRVVRYPKRRSR